MQRGPAGHYVPHPSVESRGPALRVHRLLQAQPILSIASAGAELKLSVPTVTASLKHLAKPGIARETTGRNYGRI